MSALKRNSADQLEIRHAEGTCHEKRSRIVEGDGSTASQEYAGFSLQKDAVVSPAVPTVEATITPESFFDQFISRRRPCIINALPKLANAKDLVISPQILIQYAGEKVCCRCNSNARFS